MRRLLIASLLFWFFIPSAKLFRDITTLRNLMEWSRSFGCCLAQAAEVDARAEKIVQLSPLECVVIENRIDAKDAPPVDSEEASQARGAIAKACDFATLAKTKSPFGLKRAPRRLARDVLVRLLDWLRPTKEHPLERGADEVLRPVRFEFSEVLGGRDPYK
jgi:hypothetical protein